MAARPHPRQRGFIAANNAAFFCVAFLHTTSLASAASPQPRRQIINRIMKKLSILAAIAASAALALPALAGQRMEYTSSKTYTAPPEPEPKGGLYVAIFGGVNVHQDADTQDVGGLEAELDSDTGWFAGAKFGYMMPVRSVIKPVFEVEGFYNGVDANFDVNGTSVSHDLHSGVVMFNAILKFDLGKFQPYLGAGLGYAHAWFKNSEVNGVEVDGDEVDEGTFAYQGIAGLEYHVTETVGVFTEYKALVYHDLDGIENYLHHLVGVGIRLGF